MNPEFIFFGIGVLWLTVLTIIVLKTRRHYQLLTTRTKKESIDAILDTLLNTQEKLNAKHLELTTTITRMGESAKSYYQKIGFVRFNPFERVGADNSFVIALLDEMQNGILLNFLYTREGIRVYAKRVEGGKSNEYELSSEEKEAIKKAM